MAWVVRDRGEIVASCRPWIQTSRRLVTPSVPLRFRALFGALRVAGRPPLRDDTPVDICYLTGFTVSRKLSAETAQRVAHRLVSGVVGGFPRQTGRRPHWYAVSDLRARPLLDDVLRRSACVETGGTIYDVHPRERASETEDLDLEVGWELALA